MAQTPEPRREPPALPVSYPPRKRITTLDLMQGAREIIILHQGEGILVAHYENGQAHSHQVRLSPSQPLISSHHVAS